MLTGQRRSKPAKNPEPTQSVWKRLALAVLIVAALSWTISAGRSVKASGPPAALPMSFSLAVVPVPDEPMSSELERLKIRNRRLEVLVSVLRSRKAVDRR